MQMTEIAGAQTTRSELLARIAASRTAGPYAGTDTKLVAALDRYEGDTIGDILSNADRQVTDALQAQASLQVGAVLSLLAGGGIILSAYVCAMPFAVAAVGAAVIGVAGVDLSLLRAYRKDYNQAEETSRKLLSWSAWIAAQGATQPPAAQPPAPPLQSPSQPATSPPVSKPATPPVLSDIRGDFLQNTGAIKDSKMVVEGWRPNERAVPHPTSHQAPQPGATLFWADSAWDAVSSRELTFRSGARVAIDQSKSLTLHQPDGSSKIVLDVSLNLPSSDFAPWDARRGKKPDPLVAPKTPEEATRLREIAQTTTLFNDAMSENIHPDGRIALRFNDRNSGEPYDMYEYDIAADGRITAQAFKVTEGTGEHGLGEHREPQGARRVEEQPDGTLRTFLPDGCTLDVEPFVPRQLVQGAAPVPSKVP